MRSIMLTSVLLGLAVILPAAARSQAAAKKVRLALPSTNVTFAPIFAAVRKGFYRDEGLDVEIILMRANLASSALLTGDIDYNGAVTGVIGGAVKGQPLKAVFFASSSPIKITGPQLSISSSSNGKFPTVSSRPRCTDI